MSGVAQLNHRMNTGGRAPACLEQMDPGQDAETKDFARQSPTNAVLRRPRQAVAENMID